MSVTKSATPAIMTFNGWLDGSLAEEADLMVQCQNPCMAGGSACN